MKDGFLRAACITPAIRVADCEHNAAEIIRLAKEAASNGACLIAFPELCITGSTCGNLFFQASLLRGAKDALEQICEETAELNALIIVGLPLQVGTGLYNAAAVLKDGQVLGYVQKDGIISAEEAYLFRTNDAVADDGIELNDRYLFTCDTMPELRVGVVFGDDLPYEGNTAGDLAGSGASVVVCLSALPCLAGAAKRRREMMCFGHCFVQMPQPVHLAKLTFATPLTTWIASLGQAASQSP